VFLAVLEVLTVVAAEEAPDLAGPAGDDDVELLACDLIEVDRIDTGRVEVLARAVGVVPSARGKAVR